MRMDSRRVAIERDRWNQPPLGPDQPPTASVMEDTSPHGPAYVLDADDELNPDDLYVELGGGD
jgi:hypothetical protein